MRFNGIGVAALAGAAALSLGGCMIIDVSSDEGFFSDDTMSFEIVHDGGARSDEAWMRGVVACRSHSDPAVVDLCLTDGSITNAVLHWAEVNISPGEGEAAGVDGMTILIKDN